MWPLLIAAILLVAPGWAFAQTTYVQFTPAAVYDPPPSSLSIPNSWDLESVRAERGNLAQWRDAERQRIGGYEVDARTGVARNAITGVGGYFAFFGEGELPGGVVEGRWNRPSAGVGQLGNLGARYTHRRSICDAALQTALTDISDVTYLGAQWVAEFDTLDAALALEAPAPTGRRLADGVTIQFSSFPDASRFYPQRALEREGTGVVELACLVRPDYRVTCGALSETPVGWGFAEAAHRALRNARVQDVTSDGEASSGACFQTRVRFAIR